MALRDPAEQRLAAWIEGHVGGSVTRLERLPRWRPSWDVDVTLDGRVLALHARGDRGLDYAIGFRVDYEAKVYALLEANSIPVPHAYGLCDDPIALVLDRLPGMADLAAASDESERTDLLEQYLQIQRDIYSIGIDAAAAAGLCVPETPEQIALNYFCTTEHLYEALLPERDPLIEFLRGWLHRNVPAHRDTPSFITYDAFQFLFEGGKITGLIDFEIAHVGDRLMDLASLRVRDTIKNVGVLSDIFERYEQVTGERVEPDVVDFHTIAYNAMTAMSTVPSLVHPHPTTDWVTHRSWYLDNGRWALETMAELVGVDVEPAGEMAPRRSTNGAGFEHLLARLKAPAVAGNYDDYHRRGDYRLARYLMRADQIGAAIEEADRNDLGRVLGRTPDASSDLTELLAARIGRQDPADDANLIWYWSRHLQRSHQLMGPPGSIAQRHPILQPYRAGKRDGWNPADTWPSGMIPGS